MGRRDLHRTMIAPASPEDRGAVVALWRECGLTRPWNDPVADFHLALGSGSAAVLVQRSSSGLDGAVTVGFDGHRGWVYYLAVASHCRRSGLGRALMTAAEDWLRERRCPKIQLMVRENNADALAFYAALGLERQPVVTLGRFLEDRP